MRSKARLMDLVVSCAITVSCAIALASSAVADVGTKEDLLVVITLQGKPCGEVVEHSKQGENDYDVTCKSGDRYRVYVKDGRAVVEKR